MPTKEKKELTLLERFEKYAATKSEAKRIYNLVDGQPFMEMTIMDLLAVKGMGRKGALLVMEVACDLAGKK